MITTFDNLRHDYMVVCASVTETLSHVSPVPTGSGFPDQSYTGKSIRTDVRTVRSFYNGGWEAEYPRDALERLRALHNRLGFATGGPTAGYALYSALGGFLAAIEAQAAD
jgi:hypothetical protein